MKFEVKSWKCKKGAGTEVSNFKPLSSHFCLELGV
jgi:hypothetical protein